MINVVCRCVVLWFVVFFVWCFACVVRCWLIVVCCCCLLRVVRFCVFVRCSLLVARCSVCVVVSCLLFVV